MQLSQESEYNAAIRGTSVSSQRPLQFPLKLATRIRGANNYSRNFFAVLIAPSTAGNPHSEVAVRIA
jgi:hypothetical protein